MRDATKIEVRFFCDNGKANGEQEDIIEFDAEATDEEIEADAREWFFERNTYGWERIERATRRTPAKDTDHD